MPTSTGPRANRASLLRSDDAVDERGGVAGECRAPLPGAVTKVLVAEGDVVAEGDGLVVLEAMKMEHTLRANGAGTVAQVHCVPGPAGRRARPAGHRGAGMTTPDVLRDRELQRVLRGPCPRRPRDGRRRPARRADRRLAGRADDVHPAQDAGAQRWVRPHLPARARGGAADLHRAGHHRGLQRRAGCSPRRWRPRWGSWPGARASTCTWPRSRGTTSRRDWRRCRRRGRSSSTSTPARCFRPMRPW